MSTPFFIHDKDSVLIYFFHKLSTCLTKLDLDTEGTGTIRTMQEREERLKKYSDEWFLKRYFEYGSVEAAMSRGEPLPTSVANYHRLIQKYGIVGSAGRHTSFPEVLHFFKEIALAPDTPLEQLYHEMPLTFKTSLATLHRIYQHIEANVVRRYATALFITREDKGKFLVGEELTTNTRYGKQTGAVTVPMTFSKENESAVDSIFRVLQQEVSFPLALSGEFSKKSELYRNLSTQDLQPFMYLHIVDTQVVAYHLTLPEVGDSLESFKLKNHTFIEIPDFNELQNVRTGVTELVSGFDQYLNSPLQTLAVDQISQLNRAIQPQFFTVAQNKIL